MMFVGTVFGGKQTKGRVPSTCSMKRNLALENPALSTPLYFRYLHLDPIGAACASIMLRHSGLRV